MSGYTLYAITPPTAETVRPRGPQNVGYSTDFVELLRAALHTNRAIALFGGYRLWGQRPDKSWALLEQCANGEGVMYGGDPTCWRTPAGTADLERHIAQVWSVQQYAKFLNWRTPEGQSGLAEDPEHWAASGVNTASQPADYIQGCHTRNLEKSALG